MLYNYTILPAYGRKYKTMQDMLDAWNAGKDFVIRELECYCSIRDVQAIRQEMAFAYLAHGQERLQVV